LSQEFHRPRKHPDLLNLAVAKRYKEWPATKVFTTSLRTFAARQRAILQQYDLFRDGLRPSGRARTEIAFIATMGG